MKSIITFVLPMLLSATLLVSCREEGKPSSGLKSSTDPELAMHVVTLLIVDDMTGSPVRITGINFKNSLDSTNLSYRSSNPLSRTSCRKFANEEGIVFTTWIGPVSSPGQFEITATGYESVLVQPMREETHAGGSDSVAAGDLKYITRTIRMKKSEQAAPSNR